MVEEYVVYRRFATFVPQFQITRVSQLLASAGIEADPDLWMGSRVLIALLFSFIGFLIPFSVLRLIGFYSFDFAYMTQADLLFVLGLSIGAALVSFLGAVILIYLHLYYIINDRTKRVEEILPDFLLMVSANLRAGLTPFSAFQVSARPEFGPLEKEIKIVAQKSLGSESFTEALMQLTERIDSNLLRRTIVFFEEGLRSGGKLADLLETSAEEIREMENLRRELVLNTRTYTIFLLFVLIFGMPLLLSISGQFLITFGKIQGDIRPDDINSMTSITAPQVTISEDFVEKIGIVIIVVTSLLVSILVGVIGEGKLLYGLKYFLPLAVATGAMFFVFRFLIGSFIGDLFG